MLRLIQGNRRKKKKNLQKNKMGNSRSQPSRKSKSQFLLYFLQRTWSAVIDSQTKNDRYENTDRDTDLSSRCSGCKGCGYQQDSLIFDR